MTHKNGVVLFLFTFFWIYSVIVLVYSATAPVPITVISFAILFIIVDFLIGVVYIIKEDALQRENNILQRRIDLRQYLKRTYKD